MATAKNVNSSRKRRRSLSQRSGSTEPSLPESASGTASGNLHLLPSFLGGLACDTCRMKKVKCNEGQPICGYCDDHGFRCDYRLRPSVSSSSEQVINTLLKRLAIVEEKVEKVESVIQLGPPLDSRNANITSVLALPNTPLETPPPLRTSDDQFLLSPDQLWFDILSEGSAIAERATHNYETPASFSDEAAVNARYLGKLPFTCEEDRSPLSDSTGNNEPTNTSDIMPWLQYYLAHACPMYPVMCDPSAQTISELVAAQGLCDDIESCFSLLVVALAKAHRNEEAAESGVSDFLRATHIMGRLNTQFKTKYLQAHVLCAIFLLKKGRLLDFWNSLHRGCTLLYTMLKR
ncbi:hypothetical protein D0Z07_3379 [Hyphodiscus hymeniophilus]|uniref:Zn(2)-C6 fungal-type domain-containing protein n=1 Tax=Hyphodiscus hymeniophilus TaxID=353542 RepID=A0A9P7AY10_9HELO|nr:hypothetical protein D0Z07_3379 [Hyphodiscus hymeniophilus]